ncbi:MAG: dual specificity protein phosphatase family protein [Candidatus Lokiarchaeota archaeon]|nr:dual specificity protein phosphatase family protein [Candidatus Lokiarchaeota archaeon]
MVRPSYWPTDGMPYKSEPFTWIVKGKIAASWWPDPPIRTIYENEGISVIINCSEFDNRKEVQGSFQYYHINVPDYELATELQIETFLSICEKHDLRKEPIVVHCVAGCGRTGQFLVAWGAKNGSIHKGMDPVKWIRKYRPCSLETKEQMNFARKMAKKYQMIR